MIHFTSGLVAGAQLLLPCISSAQACRRLVGAEALSGLDSATLIPVPGADCRVGNRAAASPIRSEIHLMWTGSILSLSTVLVFPAGVMSPPAQASASVAIADTKTEEGSIKSVDTKAKSFVLSVGSGKDAKEVTVKVDDKTKYTLDGKDSTMDKALVVGNKAKVKHVAGLT